MNFRWMLVASQFIFANYIVAAEYEDYRTKAFLAFPMVGESVIYFGGRSIDLNHHFDSRGSNKYAIDIAAFERGTPPITERQLKYMKETGDIPTFKGDPLKNENYFCFGMPVVSPADGVVVDTMNWVSDNTPGTVNTERPHGNFVLIDHGQNEYSMLVHLKQYSIPMNIFKGAAVRSGDLIGRCGNSGQSHEPHLHYQLQDGDDFYTSKGIPAQFNGYIADGRLVERGEPVQGQIIFRE